MIYRKLIGNIIEKSGLAEYYASVDENVGSQKVLNMQELLSMASLYPNNMDGLSKFLDQIELERNPLDLTQRFLVV